MDSGLPRCARAPERPPRDRCKLAGRTRQRGARLCNGPGSTGAFFILASLRGLRCGCPVVRPVARMSAAKSGAAPAAHAAAPRPRARFASTNFTNAEFRAGGAYGFRQRGAPAAIRGKPEAAEESPGEIACLLRSQQGREQCGRAAQTPGGGRVLECEAKKAIRREPGKATEGTCESRRYRRANKAKIAEQRRLDRKQNPEKMRKQHIQYTYGLSWDEYQAILARQGGVCGMCKTKSKRPLCVDHCHKTGMVRGILCSPCNLAIGLCRDSTKITRAATAYLEAAQKRIRRKLRGKKKKKARSSPRATRAGAVRSPATNPAAPRRRSGRKPCRPSAGRARGSRSRRGASRHRDLRGGCTRSRRSRPGGGGSRGPGCGRG